MRIIYSKKANDLFDLIDPYIDYTKIPVKLKADTPEKIRNAYDEWLKISKEEEKRYLESMGLI